MLKVKNSSVRSEIPSNKRLIRKVNILKSFRTNYTFRIFTILIRSTIISLAGSNFRILRWTECILNGYFTRLIFLFATCIAGALKIVIAFSLNTFSKFLSGKLKVLKNDLDRIVKATTKIFTKIEKRLINGWLP